MTQLNNADIRHTATLDSEVKNLQLMDEIHEDKLDRQLLNEDSILLSQKLLIIVTLTYDQSFQAYYLIHLCQTLKSVSPPLLWIVVEMTTQSIDIANILRSIGVMYMHLVCDKNITDIKDAYIHQRNVALSHIETHCLNGIVNFVDDNDIYIPGLFE